LIINENFKVDKENNIFIIRQKEYDSILDNIKEILEPVKEIGFTIEELTIKDSRFIFGELSRTVKQNLVIKIKRELSEIDLSMAIPKLIDGNYIVIGGRRKIPLFQLFDVPIITRGKTIKLRTNITTIVIEKSKKFPFINIHFLGKSIPFSLLLFSKFDKEDLFKDFELESASLEDEIIVDVDNLYDKLRSDMKMYYENSEKHEIKDFIGELGRFYTEHNPQRKGEGIVYAFDLIPKVDIMSSRFFKTNSLYEELVDVIRGREYNDLQFTNKRIRCFEYVILSKVIKTVFDCCMANITSRSSSFNISSSEILSKCNVSDIIQFDFSINPIEEITKLSRTSLVGPGGFKRENVPKHLRDIYPSMKGRVCPVDTPDRDNCGVLQDLLPNVGLDENFRFNNTTLDKQIVSAPVSLVPFLEHDDQTRLQMASSQMRQSIMLRSFDKPFIQSGTESLYTDYTQFIIRAKKDGKVVHQDLEHIIVLYNNGTTEIFDVSFRDIYIENFDLLGVKVSEGDKFKEGDILAESMFCKDGEINFGKNLLVGVMSYYGHNYEDGIVVSDKLQNKYQSAHYRNLSFILPPNKVLLSLNTEGEYKPLPDFKEYIKAGQAYAKIKKMPNDTMQSGIIWEEGKELNTTKQIRIMKVNIYPNSWNDAIPEFKEWVERKIESQQKKQKEFIDIIRQHFTKSEVDSIIIEKGLDKFNWIGKYKNKGERINGMRVELSGIYLRQLEVGDKIANRHGNKGIISQIEKHDNMPKLEDGRHVDICINPLGIISRMNIGQLYELHLSMSLYDLKNQLLQMIKDKCDTKQIKEYLFDYIKIIDNTEDNWYHKQFVNTCPDILSEDFINNLSLIQPPFESVKFEQLDKAMKYTNTKYKQKIYDPKSESYIKNEIATGFIYFFRLVHIAENRLAARGIGSYTRRTLQPPGGRKNSGGQRLGEMETSAVISQGGLENLAEFLTTKSDSTDLRNKYLKESVETNLVKTEDTEVDIIPEAVHLLNAYLKTMGVKH